MNNYVIFFFSHTETSFSKESTSNKAEKKVDRLSRLSRSCFWH
ncbi:hypothetical protein PUN28_007277 [Cardiocondyla obscurior]|uniref:Uncharacterized protein n=1 Tax=Cardiocondyla obscurior TaxID=286306 RepID=A0AAW2G2N6_9HYME